MVQRERKKEIKNTVEHCISVMRTERLKLSLLAPKKLYIRRAVNRSEICTTLILDHWHQFNPMRVKKKILIIFMALTCLTTCRTVKPHTFYYPDGTVSTQGSYKGDAQHGKWMSFYENGAIKSIEYYKNDLQTGQAIYYYRNGNLKSEQHYIKGRLKGLFTSYYESEEGGLISAQGKYDFVEYHYDKDLTDFPLLSVRIGDWTFYDTHQDIDSVVTYLGVDDIYATTDTTFVENRSDILLIDSIIRVDYKRLK